MNAAIRAVVRTAVYNNLKVLGIEEGYAGLIKGKIKRLDLRSVSGIINRGGTILKTRRCAEIKTKQGIEKAACQLKKRRIEGLVVIGGDGSFRGGWEIYKASKIPVAAIPASIDNDIAGTEETIGFDTAINTALTAIDRIRDTASSHERVFIVEVMGRKRGFLALSVGMAAGAEIILIPEIKYDLNKICEKLVAGYKRGKTSNIIIMAEGAGSSYAIAHQIKDVTGFEVRTTVLGYIQRGGAPTADSRILGGVLGYEAVRHLTRTKKAIMLGIDGGKVITRPLSYAWKHTKPVDRQLHKLIETLAI